MKVELVNFLSEIATVYWSVAPLGMEPPYVVATTVSNAKEYTLEGEDGILRPVFQIDVWAKTTLEADSLANQIHNKLSGYTGPFGTDYQCQGAFQRAYRERTEGDLYNVSIDYNVVLTNNP